MRFRSLTVVLVLSAGAAPAQDPSPIVEGYSPVQDLTVVDCLIQGQVRYFAGRPVLTPRRRAEVTAGECRRLRGEFLLFDPANIQNTLAYWLDEAAGGDPEAETMVGEIYEIGVDGGPDYAQAAEWYQKAADKDYPRAQYRLGILYEKGLGVERDPLASLNLYRGSSGLDDDSLIFQSAAFAMRAELEAEIAARDAEIAEFTRQLENLQRELEESLARQRELEEAGASEQDEAAVEALQLELDQERARIDEIQQQLARMEALVADRTVAQDVDRKGLVELERFKRPESTGSYTDAEESRYRARQFGDYFALIISVQDYTNDSLGDLETAMNDMQRVKEVLEQSYDFDDVITLANPNQEELAVAINQLHEDLTEDDNLLIYFVGRGAWLEMGVGGSGDQLGYWLPRNADPSPNNARWVPNDFISGHLSWIPAHRILVISDAAYASELQDDPGLTMVGVGHYGDEYIEWKLPQRGRLVLASGTDSPHASPTADGHSIFASALIDVLENNDQILTAPELFLRVREQIRANAGVTPEDVEPSLKAIMDGGHEIGDFFFVPASL